MEDRENNIYRFFLYQLKKEREEYVVSKEELEYVYEAILRKMVPE